MTSIAILNDVHDAEYVIQHHEKFDKTNLISTHASVDDYLVIHGLACESISSYLQPKEITQFYEEADWVNTLLAELDTDFGNALNAATGLDVKLRFFYALYRYRGRYEYMNILKLQASLMRLLSRHTPEKVFLFQPHGSSDMPSFFYTSLDIYQILVKQAEIPIEKVSVSFSRRISRREKLDKARISARTVFSDLFENPFKLVKKHFRTEVPQSAPVVIQLDSPRGLLVLINGSRSAELLPDGVRERFSSSISLEKTQSSPVEQAVIPAILYKAADDARADLSANTEFDPQRVIRAIFLEDLCRRFKQVFVPIQNLHRLRMECPVLGGIWVRPPAATNSLALLVEYLLCLGVPVVGRQHGGNFGIEVSHPKHFDSDYWWSTHYLSFGFTAEDLKESSPNLKPRCEIFPVGEKTSIPINISRRRKKVDILFPISNAISFHHEGVRTLLHELAEYQRELLKFLDQLSDVCVVVKPFPGYTYSTSASIELLRTLKNVEIVEEMPFTQAFERYSVGAVLIEFPSSPLFECLKANVEVLSLTDPLLPYNRSADLLLQKRVHFYDTLPQIKQGILDFLEGRLPSLRDDQFAERYLLPSDMAGCRTIVQKTLGLE